MSRIRITYIFTHHIRWVPFELLAATIDRSKFDIRYIILGTSDPMIEFLKRGNIPYVATDFKDYNNTPEAVRFVYDELRRHPADIVQTHWFAGSLVGLQAAYYANVPVRIFHREHPPLRYYNRHPASKHRLIWDCATHLIAVTDKSKAGMIEDGIPSDKITVIPTGFDVQAFANIDSARVSAIRDKYLIADQFKGKYPVIGLMARYVRWKGIEYAIQAFKQVLLEYPNALLILAGGHIDRSLLLEKMQAASSDDIVAPQYEDALSIYKCLSEIPEDNYLEIPFEEDLYSLFKLFDVFVHVPIDSTQETFGQVYVEAMLSKVPSVITLSGSALDHAVHKENAWIVEYMNSDQIATGILELLGNDALRKRITENAFECANSRYEINTQTRLIEQFYVKALQSAAINT